MAITIRSCRPNSRHTGMPPDFITTAATAGDRNYQSGVVSSAATIDSPTLEYASSKAWRRQPAEAIYPCASTIITGIAGHRLPNPSSTPSTFLPPPVLDHEAPVVPTRPIADSLTKDCKKAKIRLVIGGRPPHLWRNSIVSNRSRKPGGVFGLRRHFDMPVVRTDIASITTPSAPTHSVCGQTLQIYERLHKG